jgi:hypothetical protein
MNKEKRAELLLDHYKDTFQNILNHLKMRNRLFIYILVLLAFLALDSYSKATVLQWMNALIRKNLGDSATPLDLEVIGSAVLFLLLTFIIEYYKRSITVDRQYHYLTKLEEQICEAMDGDFVTREGKSYYSKTGIREANSADNRPRYLKTVGMLYIYLVPVILTLFVIFRIVTDFPPTKVTAIFNTVVGLLIVYYNVMYVVWVRFKK